jgi:hypothetical protein
MKDTTFENTVLKIDAVQQELKNFKQETIKTLDRIQQNIHDLIEDLLNTQIDVDEDEESQGSNFSFPGLRETPLSNRDNQSKSIWQDKKDLEDDDCWSPNNFKIQDYQQESQGQQETKPSIGANNEGTKRPWKGGFGAVSNFNPLKQKKEVIKEEIDYSYRPTKNKDDVEEGTFVVYVYEDRDGVEIDQEDHDAVAVEKKHQNAFDRALENIANGTKNIFSTRDPGLHIQKIKIQEYPIEIRYSKVTSPGANGSFHGLFNGKNSSLFKNPF